MCDQRDKLLELLQGSEEWCVLTGSSHWLLGTLYLDMSSMWQPLTRSTPTQKEQETVFVCFSRVIGQRKLPDPFF